MNFGFFHSFVGLQINYLDRFCPVLSNKKKAGPEQEAVSGLIFQWPIL